MALNTVELAIKKKIYTNFWQLVFFVSIVANSTRRHCQNTAKWKYLSRIFENVFLKYWKLHQRLTDDCQKSRYYYELNAEFCWPPDIGHLYIGPLIILVSYGPTDRLDSMLRKYRHINRWYKSQITKYRQSQNKQTVPYLLNEYF